jgi:alpha-ketoglutarate-dependent taurine dioxygenase
VSWDLIDPEAARTLDVLIGQIDRVVTTITTRPGDVLILDNYRAVHGRQAFAARFDGTDRWLRRINITRDPRRSREYRTSPTDRVIG